MALASPTIRYPNGGLPTNDFVLRRCSCIRRYRVLVFSHSADAMLIRLSQMIGVTASPRSGGQHSSGLTTTSFIEGLE